MSTQTFAAAPDKSDAVIQTIIVPLDGSALAEAALPPARRLARITNATLVLVLVRVAQTRSFGGDALAAQDAAVTEAEAYLRRIAHDLRYRDVAVHTDVFVNDPTTGIAVAALAHGADVIVMSTHGRSGVSRVLLGSVAERVLRETALPVVLVRGVHGVDLSTLPPGAPTARFSSRSMGRRWPRKQCATSVRSYGHTTPRSCCCTASKLSLYLLSPARSTATS